MWHQIILLSLTMAAQTINIFDFSSKATIDQWQIVNDGVMGGLSKSSIQLSKEGHGKFAGHVSLENNGGFASIRLPTDVEVENDQQEIILNVKGDGKNYQCRLKESRNQSESYVYEFSTNGEWQIIKIKLNKFAPQYRGRKLNRPNFNFDKIKLFGFLISNKKEEDFELLVDSIELK